jgi:hypothetical protein
MVIRARMVANSDRITDLDDHPHYVMAGEFSVS